MPYRDQHTSQAEHNERLCGLLMGDMIYRDWVVTAAFYSALHYIDGYLATLTPPIHPDSNIPMDVQGRQRYTPHAWRSRLVFQYLGRDCYKSYKKLKDDSFVSRYLTKGMGAWISQAAHDYFSTSHVEARVNNDLQAVKIQAGFL